MNIIEFIHLFIYSFTPIFYFARIFLRFFSAFCNLFSYSVPEARLLETNSLRLENPVLPNTNASIGGSCLAIGRG